MGLSQQMKGMYLIQFNIPLLLYKQRNKAFGKLETKENFSNIIKKNYIKNHTQWQNTEICLNEKWK